MVWKAMRDACIEMLHGTNISAYADFISLIQSQILCILGIKL